jgi:hypothetical protein
MIVLARIGEGCFETDHEPRDHLLGVHKRYLLTQHGTDGKLESIPYARHAQTGPCLKQLAELRVLGKVIRNPQWVGSEIQHPSYPFNHEHQLFVARQCHSHAEQSSSDAGLTSISPEPVAILFDEFHAGRFSGLGKANQGVPIEGGRYGRWRAIPLLLAVRFTPDRSFRSSECEKVERRSHGIVELPDALNPE